MPVRRKRLWLLVPSGLASLFAMLHPGVAAARPLPAGPPLIASQTPFATPRAIHAVSCVSGAFCAAIDGSGHVLTSADPAASGPSWHLQTVKLNARLTTISCPSASFCAIGDKESDIFTSVDPGRPGARWSEHAVAATPEGVEALSCPSSSLCVALSSGDMFSPQTVVMSSRDPARGAAADWGTTRLHGISLQQLSCPSARTCFAAEPGSRRFAVSHSPGRPHTGWRMSRTPQEIDRLSCPSETLCVAYSGNSLLSTTNPLTGGRARWSVSESLHHALAAAPTAISCASVSLCAVTTNEAAIAVSSDAALGTASTWKVSETHTHYYVGALSCAAELCVAASNIGRAIALDTRTGTHTTSYIDGYDPLEKISCAGSFCAALGQGMIFTTTHLGAPASGWSRQTIDSGGLSGVSCPSQDFCAAAGEDGRVFVSRDPSAPASWRATAVPGATQLTAISCAGSDLCIAAGKASDSSEAVYSSTEPASAVSSGWVRDRVPLREGGLLAVSCGTTRLCMAVGSGGGFATSTDPTLGVNSHWSERVIRSSLFTGVSCDGERLCALSEYSSGAILLSTDPSRGEHAHWRFVQAFREFPPEDDATISCAGRESCLVTEERGRASFSDDVRSRHPRWRSSAIEPSVVTPPDRTTIGHLEDPDAVSITDASCSVAMICGVVDSEGHVVRVAR